MIDFSVCAVLPAGGSGQRMSLQTPKQYCEVLGRQLFLYTVEAFESAPWINKVVLVVSKDRIDFVKSLLETYGHERTVVVEGGSSRHWSIRKGVESLSSTINGKASPDVVLIHDVVRPFLEEEILKKVAIAARDHGAAGAIKPLVSTVVARDPDGFLDCSLDRSKYHASEMPQGFRLDVIKTAYEKCTDYDMEYGTECLHLAQKYSGVNPKLVDTDYDLWKVTYLKDLFAAEGIIKSRLTDTTLVAPYETKELFPDISHHLKRKNIKVEVVSEVPPFRNSIIVLSKSAESLRRTTERCWTHLKITSILIHLCYLQNDDLDSEGTLDLIKLTLLLADQEKKQHSNLIINTVVFKESSQIEKIADVLSSLITDRKTEYSGQTFFC